MMMTFAAAPDTKIVVLYWDDDGEPVASIRHAIGWVFDPILRHEGHPRYPVTPILVSGCPDEHFDKWAVQQDDGQISDPSSELYPSVEAWKTAANKRRTR